MFAVLKTGGKQYKVASGDVLRVEKLAADAGDTIQFNDILMIGSKIGAPMVAGAAVQAEVIDQIKGDKVINFVRRRRKHSSKRTVGHRQQLTLVRITELMETGGDKSGVKAAIGAAMAGAVATAAAKPAAAKKAPAKKAAAPKAEAAPAAEKPAAKKAPAKKAAASGEADDLTQISGVGPVIVKKLHDLGVTTFAQIAAWTKDDIAAMDEKLNFKGRIDRDEWLKQAKKLAKG